MIGMAAALMGIVASTLTAGLPPRGASPANGEAQPAGWVVGDVYDLKVGAVFRCSSPGRPGTLLGVELRVRSRTKTLFVAPRDVSLRDGGVLFPALRELEVPGCGPVLKPTQLRRGAETGGIVVFEVPARTGKLMLEYGPTRWGGAARLSVALPIEQERRVSRARAKRAGPAVSRTVPSQ